MLKCVFFEKPIKNYSNTGDSAPRPRVVTPAYRVKSSLFYRNIQNAQKETAKDNSVT